MSKTQDQGLVYRRAFITLDKRLQNFKFLDKLVRGGEGEVIRGCVEMIVVETDALDALDAKKGNVLCMNATWYQRTIATTVLKKLGTQLSYAPLELIDCYPVQLIELYSI